MSSIKRHRYATERGIDFIKSWEKLKLKTYDDGYGYKTIGYGHLQKDGDKNVISGQEALEILKRDLFKSECVVIRNTSVPLSDNGFDSLVSFVFNCGGGAYQRSGLRQKLNRNERAAAAQEFLKWIRSDGKVSRGLMRRREAERRMFLEGLI